MQKGPRISLNAVRVFEAAARNGSLKTAGEELSVTASAVSHQIKALEEGLGVALFERRSNAVLLSEAGRRFLEDITPALSTIERAADALRRSASDVVLRLGVTLAVRWLIPRLERFKQRHPEIRIRLETTHYAEVPLDPDVDLAISYVRITAGEKAARRSGASGIRLMQDVSRPVLAPGLLAASGYRSLADIATVPVLSATRDDWDWHYWCARAAPGLEGAVRIADRFDTDDAAIHGAVAGMGMVLMPPAMTLRELEAGSLVELPGAPGVEMGDYYLLTTPHPRPAVERFRRWLLKESPDPDARL